MTDDARTSPAVLLAIGAATLIAVGVLPRLVFGRHPLVGKPAPDFELEVVHNGEHGSKLKLSALRGKPVLVDFWATWCGPCQLEAPILSRLAERYKDRGLVVVGVDTSDRPGMASIFAEKKSLSYPILFDDVDVASRLYGVESLPTMIVIGKDGNIRAVRTGLVDEGSLEALVSAEL